MTCMINQIFKKKVMKKIISISGIALIAMIIFVSNNNVKMKDINLADVMNIYSANAEGSTVTCDTFCTDYLQSTCSFEAKDSEGAKVTVTCHDMKKQSL